MPEPSESTILPEAAEPPPGPVQSLEDPRAVARAAQRQQPSESGLAPHRPLQPIRRRHSSSLPYPWRGIP